jgi:hypothetical protein
MCKCRLNKRLHPSGFCTNQAPTVFAASPSLLPTSFFLASPEHLARGIFVFLNHLLCVRYTSSIPSLYYVQTCFFCFFVVQWDLFALSWRF